MVKRIKPRQDDVIAGSNLRRIRLQKQLSQEKIAEYLGVAYQQVQKYEAGTNRISVSRLCQISNILETPPVMFFEGTSAYRAMAGYANVPVPASPQDKPPHFREMRGIFKRKAKRA